MILLDCGNSSLKAQSWEAGRLQASYACSYQSRWTHNLLRWLQTQNATHCYLASVLDATRQTQLEQCLNRIFSNPVVRFVSEKQALGVINAYQQPERLGVDRWLALLACAEIATADAIVIDAGSAITLDLLRADGQHLGGAILPGVNTSIDQFKRIFSHIDFNHPAIVETADPGCSTEAAIHIDYPQSSIELIPELVNRWTPLFENEVTLLLAGGDAARVQRVLGQRGIIRPDLVFRGMRRLVDQ
ncbi:MAG: type III pantothenate kinase [Gammaproteobacteria bacterium]|nr:type III pantothenate kinase [Gammaproteobacteria bacterium]